MRTNLLTMLRFGPSVVYATAAAFLFSMYLLAWYPSIPLAWAIHMTLLPVMREPVYVLLGLPGMSVGVAAAAMIIAAVAGLVFAIHPARYLRSHFIHAHIALLACILTMGRASNAQAALSVLSPPRVLQGDWWFLSSLPPLSLVLFLLVLPGCISVHATVIKQMAAR